MLEAVHGLQLLINSVDPMAEGQLVKVVRQFPYRDILLSYARATFAVAAALALAVEAAAALLDVGLDASVPQLHVVPDLLELLHGLGAREVAGRLRLADHTLGAAREALELVHQGGEACVRAVGGLAARDDGCLLPSYFARQPYLHRSRCSTHDVLLQVAEREQAASDY